MSKYYDLTSVTMIKYLRVLNGSQVPRKGKLLQLVAAVWHLVEKIKGMRKIFRVLITNRFMKDFVTSHMAIVEFNHKEDAEKYARSSEGYHPGRFSYQIIEKEKRK